VCLKIIFSNFEMVATFKKVGELNYTSRLKTSEINFIALSLSSISFGSNVNDKPGIDLTNFAEYELLLEVNPDTS